MAAQIPEELQKVYFMNKREQAHEIAVIDLCVWEFSVSFLRMFFSLLRLSA